MEGQPLLQDSGARPRDSLTSVGQLSLGPEEHAHQSPTGAHYHIDINPTIYSAIVYAPAISRVKTGEGYLNRATGMVCSMIALNMLIQMGLLRIMDIYGHRASQGLQAVAVQSESYVKTYESFLSPMEKDVVGQMEDRKDPLCERFTNGTYSCMPPSIRFASEWKDLDTDQDGVWSISEALSAEDSKHKDISKRQMVFFNSIVRGLKKRAEWMEQQNSTFYLSKDVVDGHGIPRAYYDYWMGDAMFCTRYDSNACENIVASGLFDAALKKGRKAAAHKGIADYTSAAKYCRMMLNEHGGCEASLPGTYSSAVIDRGHMCGSVSLGAGGVLTNPHDPTEVMVVVKPSYSNLEQQKQASHVTFLFFTVLIIFLFYSSLVDEIRDLIKTVDFLANFPGIYDSSDRGGIDRGEDCGDKKRYKIERISPKHRIILLLVVILRIIIIFMLLSFGSWFLLTEKSYLELVMNAVALSFITGVDEMIYEVFMESAEKQDIGFDEAERLKFRGCIPRDDGSLSGYLFRKDVWGLFVIPVVAVAVVLGSYYSSREPVINALTCACQQEGKLCAESMFNQKSWWNHYWTQTLPAAMHHIEALRLQGV